MTTINCREEIEQTMITRLVNQGFNREDATRIAYAKGTHYSETEIRQAQRTYSPKAFSLLKK